MATPMTTKVIKWPVPAGRTWNELHDIIMRGSIPVTFHRDGNVFVAEIDIPLRDGKVLTCRGKCSLREAVAKELGHDPDELGEAISDAYGDAQVGAVFHPAFDEDEIGSYANTTGNEIIGEYGAEIVDGYGGHDTGDQVGNIFHDIGKVAKGVAKGTGIVQVGKVIKKAAKSRAFKKALKIAGSVVRNPAFMAAVGAVTGGAALPALAAAGTAMSLMDVAHKAIPGSKHHKAALNVVQAAMLAADRTSGKAPLPKGVTKQNPLTAAQDAKLKEYLATVDQDAAKVRARTLVQDHGGLEQAKVNAVLPAPSAKDVARYLVSIAKTVNAPVAVAKA